MRDVRIYQRRLEPTEIGVLSMSPFREVASDSRLDVADDSEPSPGVQAVGLDPTLAAMLPEDSARPFLEIDGQRVTVNGRPGQVYVLESSSDLQGWTPLARGESQTGTIVYRYPEQDAPMRFYRVRVAGLKR